MNIINKYVEKVTDKVTKKIDKLVEPLFDVKGPNNIDSFRQKLSGGVALTNQFIAGFSFPSFLNESNLISLLGVSNFDNDIGIYCYNISNPTKKIKTETVNIYNNLNRTIPTSYSWDTLKLSFIETSNRKIYSLFDEWITKINNPATNCGVHYSDSYGQIKCSLVDRKGNEKRYIVYDEAIPTSVSFSDLNWNSTNELVAVTVEFSYIYPITKDYGITEVVNSLYDIGSSDIAKTAKNTLSTISHWF